MFCMALSALHHWLIVFEPCYVVTPLTEWRCQATGGLVQVAVCIKIVVLLGSPSCVSCSGVNPALALSPHHFIVVYVNVDHYLFIQCFLETG